MAAKVDLGLVAFDVGARKHAFAVAMGERCEHGELENTPEAVQRFLAARRAQCGRLRVLMEATGIYYLDLALLAVEAGAEVMVINPKAAHHFARAISQRSKTDALDARMLLTYLQRMPFRPWQPPNETVLALRQFGRHLGQLNEQRTVNQVLALVRADARLAAQFDALDSIIGIGPATALPLLGELLVLPQDMNSRACVCHAGLDVRLHQSGTSVAAAPRLSKHGNKYLRRALYMPALTAIRHDPHARAFRDRLIARGKKKMQAIAAVMRKLLTAAWALLRNPATYDGSKLFAAGEG